MLMDWFNTPEPEAVGKTASLRVSEVSALIEGFLDNPALQDIWVRGEVTNYTHHARGHRYFSLSEKGEGSTAAIIKCVMWRSDADRLAFSPGEGMEILAQGTIRHYAPHGVYQLQIREMTRSGIGEKFLLVERWKKELALEGCFASDRKRPLPQFPARIGVVTSETGAVIHDICTVVRRRYPVEIIISPTAVQGEDAPREISRAIERLANRADVIIVARGGGSFEDLFPFNHPDVVRAITASPVPVVSAIGHEVDVTLSDLAADLRAPTPSAAAELTVPDRKVLIERLTEMKIQMSAGLLTRIGYAKEEIAELRDRLRPRRFMRRLEDRKQQLADLSDRFGRAFSVRLGRERLLLKEMATALSGCSPLAVLARGYCVVEKQERIVKSAAIVAAGDRLKIRFADGRSQVLVERVEHDGKL